MNTYNVHYTDEQSGMVQYRVAYNIKAASKEEAQKAVARDYPGLYVTSVEEVPTVKPKLLHPFAAAMQRASED